MRGRILGTAAAVVMVLTAAAQLPAIAASCADPAPGGEWRSYGGTPSNQRAQTAQTTINPGTVANIESAWVFNARSVDQAGVLNGGTFQNTPVVADGCVYLASSTGFVFALNAQTGERVWTSFPGEKGAAAGSLLGGIITGSPSVVNGRIYVAVAKSNAPFVVALDQATGAIVWEGPVLDPAKAKPEYRTNVVAAPVVWNDVVFQGIMGEEDKPGARGGYAILDVATGALLRQDWTITDAEYAAGYRGASIWCTSAVDTETGYAYACGGNPASKQQEARHSNALLKIDLDRTRPTFGTIVDSYKGNVDQYYPGLDRQPACDQVPTTLVWSPTCAQLDLDFGASPSLYEIDVAGDKVKVIGDLQKSGVYHAVYADDMSMAWTAVVGAPGPTFNAGSPAVDGSNVYTAAVPPGQMVALSNDRGRYRWVAPIGTGPATHFQSTSVANGVVFSMDNLGELHAFDAATGVPLKRWPVSLDTGSYAGDLSSQGVAIARDTVYAASSSFVVAYR